MISIDENEKSYIIFDHLNLSNTWGEIFLNTFLVIFVLCSLRAVVHRKEPLQHPHMLIVFLD